MGKKDALGRACFVTYMGRLCVARLIDPLDYPQPKSGLAVSAADEIMRATGPLAVLEACAASGPLIAPDMADVSRVGRVPGGIRQAGLGQIGSMFGPGAERRCACAAALRTGFQELRAALAEAPPNNLLVIEEARLWAAAREGLALAARLASAAACGPGAAVAAKILVERDRFRVAAFACRPPVCGVPGVICSGEPFRPGVIGVPASLSMPDAAEMIRRALRAGAGAWSGGGPSRYAAAMEAVVSADAAKIRECESCGAPQIARLASPRARYCSDACRAQGRRVRQRAARQGRESCHELAVC